MKQREKDKAEEFTTNIAINKQELNWVRKENEDLINEAEIWSEKVRTLENQLEKVDVEVNVI